MKRERRMLRPVREERQGGERGERGTDAAVRSRPKDGWAHSRNRLVRAAGDEEPAHLPIHA
jgi:hypothetical protein